MRGPVHHGLRSKVLIDRECLCCGQSFQTRYKHRHVCSRFGCQKVLDGRSGRGFKAINKSHIEDFLS